jgi:predicted regulator of Ras-like GTPase activity (Roadblock/LC7/MglB family)
MRGYVYLKPHVFPPVSRAGGTDVGRESLSALEEASLSFLSAIDPDRGLDAALLLRRTGIVLASWSRGGIRLEVVSVMAATMLASIDTIMESLGAATPKSVWVESGDHQIAATNVGPQAFLVVIAPKTVKRRVVRNTIRDLVAHLPPVSRTRRRRTKGSERAQRVNVHPP